MVNLLVSVLVVLPALSAALMPVKRDIKFKTDLKYLGCYADDGRDNRAFRNAPFNFRTSIKWVRDWKDLSRIVEMCAKEVLRTGRTVFSVQDWGECRTDPDPDRYKMFKKSSKCYSHVGADFANAVYEIHTSCINDPKYANGRTYYIPRGVRNCDACKCIGGQTNCNVIVCDYSSPCETYAPARENTCCRKCACQHLGKDKMNGEEWDYRVNRTCNQCRCINGEAICSNTRCLENCPNPEYIPGKCCPRCRPKAPTTSPWEIISLPTTRPAPTFPPWIAAGFGKRSLRKKRNSKSEVLKKMFKGY